MLSDENVFGSVLVYRCIGFFLRVELNNEKKNGERIMKFKLRKVDILLIYVIGMVLIICLG